MKFKFWRQGKKGGTAPGNSGAKLPKPKELPQQIGMYLVVHEQLDPDWVWQLKCVVRQRQEGKNYFDFRVYSPLEANTAHIEVINYDSLDGHPELILFKGRYAKDARDPELDRTQPMPRAA